MTHEQCSLATNLELATFYSCNLKSTKSRTLWVFLVKLLPNDMAVCCNHADSFEQDTVSAASIWKYDRYEPRLGARSCHMYLKFWQDLKISIYYVNHVLLVILGLMGTFKNVFKILIVQIPCWGWTLHLTMQRHEWSYGRLSFSSKGWFLTFCQKTKHIQICSLKVPHYLKIAAYW